MFAFTQHAGLLGVHLIPDVHELTDDKPQNALSFIVGRLIMTVVFLATPESRLRKRITARNTHVGSGILVYE